MLAQRPLITLVLLAGLALAQTPVHPARVVFPNVYPPDCKVYYVTSLGLEYWGRSDQPLVANEAELRRKTGLQLELRFTHDGFHDGTWKLEAGEFWPATPEEVSGVRSLDNVDLHLKPLNAGYAALYWMKNYPRSAAAWALLLAGLGAGLLRALLRNRRLQALRASAERSDPMLANGPARIGPYLAVRRLGMGGMATVYWAVPASSLRDSEAVAIKVVQAQYAEDPEFRQRFARECRLATELEHPAIVHTLESNTQEGLLYLVMELVEGETLKSLIPPGGMEVARALKLLEPVLDGLIYAHEKGVVHRDLKPENIMVVTGERCKIMDFGLAKRSDVSDLTRTGTALGTPAYLPPEQFLGADLDVRSDQYSLGITIYQMLTGRVPFEGSDPMAVAFRHVNEAPTPPREVRTDLSPALERVILRTICKDPTQRFASLAEVREALRQAVNDPQAFRDWSYPPPTPRRLTEVAPAQKGGETQAMETESDETVVGLQRPPT